MDAHSEEKAHIWRHKHLLIVEDGAKFPDRCVFCNSPVIQKTNMTLKLKTFVPSKQKYCVGFCKACEEKDGKIWTTVMVYGMCVMLPVTIATYTLRAFGMLSVMSATCMILPVAAIGLCFVYQRKTLKNTFAKDGRAGFVGTGRKFLESLQNWPYGNI